jgi:serine/threonine-protein kinase
LVWSERQWSSEIRKVCLLLLIGRVLPMVQSVVRQGRKFGRYQLLLEMARGGMAALYLARLRGPERFEKLLVVKLIHEHLATEDEFIQMFLDEARITAMIQHPNVATVHEMGIEEGTYYLAIEYIHGQNFRDVLRSAARNPDVLHWSHAVQITSEAAAGLHAAHELVGSDGSPLGVVHRDVSPANILVSYGGDVKLIDFGIAYAAERLTQTRTGTVKGKAAYMSPEHVCGNPLDRRSDIFSLGTVLYEAVTMRRLFRADNEAATLLRVRDCVVPPPRKSNPDLPVELEKILLKALAPERDDRFATAGEFSEELQQLLKSEHFVTRQQLGRTMERLFHDRRVVREQQIKLAQEEETSYPQPALGGQSDTHASSTLAQVSELQRKAIRPSVLTVVGGALVVITITALMVYLIGRDRWFKADRERPAAASAAARAGDRQAMSMKGPRMRPAMQRAMSLMPPRGPADPPKYVPVTIEVRILPRFANPVVKFRGKPYPGSTFRMVVPKSATEELIEITAKGYHTESVFIIANKDVTEKVTLVPDGTMPVMAPPRTMRRRTMRWRTMRPRTMRPRGMRRPMGVIDLVMDI